VSIPAGVQIPPTAAEKFFGLSARPFSLTPDLRFAYHSRSHTHALEQVTSALRRREGLIVVTGAIGTGKTMLCRSMLESFESRTFLSVILDPGLEVEDLLRKILTDFGIISGVDATRTGPLSEVTRHQFVSTLQQFLASLIPLKAHAVIMIDEAQHLNVRVLEEIRLLSNFETDEAKLLQIVLVGQPDLDDVLRKPMMQQLNQRVARRCELQPLSESEVGDYIERRLTVAASPAALSGGVDPGIVDTAALVRFAPAAVKAVAAISGGIPRVVNTLCDRALEAAYERQLRTVDRDAVVVAAERLRLDVPGGITLPGRPKIVKTAAAAVALLVLGGLGWWAWAARSGPADSATTTPTASRQAAAPVSRGSTQDAAGEAVQPAPSPVEAPAPVVSTPSPSTTPLTPPPTAPPATAGDARGAAAMPSAPAPAPAPAPDTSGAVAMRPVPASGAGAAAGGFQIAVAAFRTEARAREVAAAIAAMQIRAAVRPDTSGTWYRVIAGPFTTREATQAAQDALSGAGYTGTLISPLASDPR